MDFGSLAGPIFAACFTGLVTGVGVYVAVTNRLTKMETLIETLKTEVERHNQVVERTYTLEANQNHIFHELSEIKNDLKG